MQGPKIGMILIYKSVKKINKNIIWIKGQKTFKKKWSYASKLIKKLHLSFYYHIWYYHVINWLFILKILYLILAEVPGNTLDFKNICLPKSVAYAGFSNGVDLKINKYSLDQRTYLIYHIVYYIII